MNAFANWLTDQMKMMGWSQAELARRTGLTRQAINYYLAGKSKEPDRDSLYKIARAFKLSPVIVFRAAGMIPPDPQSDEFTEKIQGILDSYIDPATKQKALEYLEYLAVQEEKAEYKIVRKPAKG